MASNATTTESSTTEVRLTPGTLIRGRWKVVRRLGEGGCGVVYQVQHVTDGKQAALKVEPLQQRKDDEILKMEVHVLKRLRGSPHICDLITCGKDHSFNFMVMTLLGPNLGELRRMCEQEKFTLSTAMRLGRQSFSGIYTVHSAGFVHRDIKPANFAIGTERQRQRVVYILDFGLARSFQNKEGQIREPRTDVAFRGTIRYCSINVHRRMEQGRHDDLWSWLYMLIEMIKGVLPWRQADRRDTMHSKERDSRELFRTCPDELVKIAEHLHRCHYRSKPHYELIDDVLKQVIRRKTINLDEPFDWEEGGRSYNRYVARQRTSPDSTSEPDPVDQPFDSGNHSHTDTKSMPKQ